MVLSGFQKPLFWYLWDKALEWDVKYWPDWTPDSTHLLCAFAKAQKHSLVLGLRDHIAYKEWMLDCHHMSGNCPPRGTSGHGQTPPARMGRETGRPDTIRDEVPSFPRNVTRPKRSPLRQPDPAHSRHLQPQKRSNQPDQGPRKISTLRGSGQKNRTMQQKILQTLRIS